MSFTQSTVSPYLTRNQSFIARLPPSEAVNVPTSHILYVLEKTLGKAYYSVFRPENTYISPLKARFTEGVLGQNFCNDWMRSANMVGINVRTIGSFWNVIKYALTLPKTQNVVHLLPIWEPGVVASLYGVASWNINPEFFSDELYAAMPHLDTIEKQLKVVINILHAMDKIVGMDVIPHTDRFSEQVLANPHLFEWLQRVDYQIVKHDNNLHDVVKEAIFDYLVNRYPHKVPKTSDIFFSDEFTETARLRIMFGEPYEYEARRLRREGLIQWLYEHHFETVPATMGPPYRGLKVARTDGARTVDERGRVWRDFEITKPEPFSRVFGPLTRYKLYENKNDNANWEIDFSKPRVDTFEYVAKHYANMQETYNFDFMRGDMAHVQMRPEGVPEVSDKYYDILKYIKNYIQVENDVPYFANFAETFIAPPDVMAYGDEIEHLEQAEAEATLGDLQSMVVGSERFMTEFAKYLDILHTCKVAPAFTLMTADKDDPRFDEFYVKGNEARLFIALFLPEMPSYMGLGFEQRDVHLSPAPNEHYTKLYVFHLDYGKNITKGDYVWGKNYRLFDRIDRIRQFSDTIYSYIVNKNVTWLLKPHATIHRKIVAWSVGHFLFVVNLNTEDIVENIKITPPQYKASKTAENEEISSFSRGNCLFSTFETIEKQDNLLIFDGLQFHLNQLKAGEGRVYKLSN